MNVFEGSSKPDKKINEVIQEVEETYFIGRKDELKFFHEYIQSENPTHKVIHFYGNGGIGKTYLLHEFSRIAVRNNIPFIHLDSQDFTHTPQGFIEYLQTVIPTFKAGQDSPKSELLFSNNTRSRIIIAVDTYERMEDLDRWFRNAFIRQLDTKVSIILAGRTRLTGEWQESPAWRKITKQMEITPLNYQETEDFLDKNGMPNKHDLKQIWQFTGGHPLLLTLAVISTISNQEKVTFSDNRKEILSILTKRWLQEVTNEQLYSLIEVAALFHQFDQNCLSEILHYDITNQQFHELISLSFIEKTRKGWSFHELIRDAIRMELKQRNPERYVFLTKKVSELYYQRIMKHPTIEDIASFFYHIGDEVIQSVFFQDATIDTSMYLDPVSNYNFHEVIALFNYLKSNLATSSTKYYNRTTDTSFQFDASLEHNQREQELLGPEYIQKMGYDGANLLKDKNGEVIGISIIVPIHERTLPFLENEPVSRAYFSTLSKKERDSYDVPVERTAGYFIRYLDYKDPSNHTARSYLMYSLFPLIFYGSKIIASTPLKLFQELLYKFGFQTVAGATHLDFIDPSPTFLLDISGPRLIPYLKNFLQDLTTKSQLDILAEEFSLTNREQDIIKLIFEEKTIVEIAKELYLAEVTVKKALSRIYQKANVKNRIQLMKRIMEIV